MRHRCASCCVSCRCGFRQLSSRWRKQRMRKGRKGSRSVRERMATGFGGGILFSAVTMATAHDDGDGRRRGSKPHFTPFSHLLTFRRLEKWSLAQVENGGAEDV
ncbi:hypothetical protein E2542_SST15627 [Spatholobus suberectus]|nr:hypothetical protein E2542_SST15627 [Spatholobus suberectus]